MKPEWYDTWLRTGRIPDGRICHEVHMGTDSVNVCCDDIVLERTRKGLDIPAPGEVAEDGFVTPWELLQA